jgi:arylsulfatase A-like enzyme
MRLRLCLCVSVSASVCRTIRKGYYSAVTWVDYLFGQLLAKLDALGRTNDTAIVVMSDHGFTLGGSVHC